MPNALAAPLVALGVFWTVIGLYRGELFLGDLGLLSFALLIALNCQNWKQDREKGNPTDG